MFTRYFRVLSVILLLASAAFGAEPLTLRTAVELALRHSTAVGVANADLLRARAAYLEVRNAFLPQVVVGSGLAATYGYPLSIEGAAPSIFNVNYQSALYNPAQRDFMHSARLEWQAASVSTEEQRKDVILDTAVTYAQLDTVMSQLSLLREELGSSDRLVSIVQQRLQAGVDSNLTFTQTRLVSARVRVRVAELEGTADLLRQKLGQLTGISDANLEVVHESIPQFAAPADPPTTAASDPEPIESSAGVKAAEQRAEATALRARGEHRVMWPAIDMVGQYGLFSRYNNYDQYFSKFQRNNATFGVAVRFPFLNYAQRARAEGADAEALKARKQVDAAREQASAQVLNLRRTAVRLEAAQQVAELESEVAKANLQATEARIQAAAPGGGAGATMTTAASPRDLETARIEAGERYSSYLDASFELEKARLQLLRASGELEEWTHKQP